MSPSSILTIAHNLFRQFLNVTFNKIVCQLVLFLFYETPPPDLLSSLLLVLLAGYFGFQVSARQLSAESGAERASKRRSNCDSHSPLSYHLSAIESDAQKQNHLVSHYSVLNQDLEFTIFSSFIFS